MRSKTGVGWWAPLRRQCPKRTRRRTPRILLEWLQGQKDFAGQPVLYEVVAQLHGEAFCPTRRLKPIPWRTVAKALDALPGVQRHVQHIDTDDGRRIKKHVYRLPDVRATVVELDAARKCA